jgi:predicted aspartyl protease
VAPTPAQPGVTVIHRPIIPIRVIGSTGDASVLALLDTGADETLLPAFLIPQIGAVINLAETALFRGVGGQLVTVSYGTVELELRKGRTRHRWTAKVGFLDGHNEAILGHVGFFQYFTATFNTPQCFVKLSAHRALLP